MTVKCGQCGEPIVGESPDGDPAARNPCPKCGSRSRNFEVAVQAATSATAKVDATVITYPQDLLTLAGALIDEGRYGIAVVVAHMACEVAAERALADGFRNKGIRDLEEPITDLLNGYNLANNRNRNLYVALTGNQIQNKDFWPNFKVSAQRRNRIIHNSQIVNKAEAVHSFQAATDLVSHLGQ